MDDGHVGERICPVGVSAGNVNVGFGCHPHVADAVSALHLVEVVLRRDRLGVADVLNDFERVPERQNLRVTDRLNLVGERLQVAAVIEREGRGVVGRLVDLGDAGADGAQLAFNLRAAPQQPL